MTTFAVDLELVAAMIDRMLAFERRAVGVGEEVEARLRRVHGVWTGVAADDGRAAYARWASAAQDMHEALAVLRSIATTAHGNYTAASRANVAMWSS